MTDPRSENWNDERDFLLRRIVSLNTERGSLEARLNEAREALRALKFGIDPDGDGFALVPVEWPSERDVERVLASISDPEGGEG